MIFEVHQQPKPCAQRWSTTKSREGRLSYRQASDAVDDKYQRVEEHQKPKPRALRWFSGLSVSYPCRYDFLGAPGPCVLKRHYSCPEVSRSYMALIVNIKRQRALEWEKIIEENNESLLVVSTMDVFIKWRAGEIKGYANRYFIDLRSVSSAWWSSSPSTCHKW